MVRPGMSVTWTVYREQKPGNSIRGTVSRNSPGYELLKNRRDMSAQWEGPRQAYGDRDTSADGDRDASAGVRHDQIGSAGAVYNYSEDISPPQGQRSVSPPHSQSFGQKRGDTHDVAVSQFEHEGNSSSTSVRDSDRITLRHGEGRSHSSDTFKVGVRSDDAGTVVLRGDSSELTIKPGILQPGYTYTVRATAVLSQSSTSRRSLWTGYPDGGTHTHANTHTGSIDTRNNSTQQTHLHAYAETTLSVTPSELIASISGGSQRIITVTSSQTTTSASTVRLDASRSYDPDVCVPISGMLFRVPGSAPREPCTDDDLTFMWECVTIPGEAPCRVRASGVLMKFGANLAGSSREISVDVSGIDLLRSDVGVRMRVS
jgi:hypothetical protein